MLEILMYVGVDVLWQQSTGDSLDEDHETRKNTAYNEFIDEDNPQTPEEVTPNAH